MHNSIKTLSIAALCVLTATGIPAAAEPATYTGNGRTVTVTRLTPNIVKVVNTPEDMAEPARQTVLEVPASDESGSYLNIDLTDGVLTITNTLTDVTLTDNGMRPSADGTTTLALVNSGKGHYYGAGERGHKVNLRGDTLVNYNRQNYGYTGTDPRISQMNITMPIVVTSDGFALVFDDFAASSMVLGDTITYTTESALPVTYYYIGGKPDVAELTAALTTLTGRQPLPPLWALGYINSKYGYKSPEETIAVVDSLKGLGYPLDGTVLDLYWFGKEEDMGYLDWDRATWPDPAGMMRQLKDRGVNLVTVSEPYILTNGTGVDNFNVLSADSMLVRTADGATHPVTIWVGEGGMFDVSNPATRRWLSDRYRMLTDLGIGGWWGDLGEPEVHPETGYHANGLTARLYHNKYGNDWASIISELYDSVYPDTRHMTLMRGGTTGLQREGVFPWSTDVSRSWGGLEPQVRIMLHSGLSGLGYMSSDLGGFAVDPEDPYLPELYMRWLEMGLFTPVFRTHAQEYAEPFNYPDYAGQLLNLAKERYRWLPYNYTLALENSRTGLPLVRPVGLDATAAAADSIFSDQYLWGPDVMVAPVLAEGVLARKVVFPAGSDWYSADGLTVYPGGSEAIVDAPLGHAPIFYRAGAVIPMADYAMENTGDYRSDEYTLHYYPASAEYTSVLLDDDKTSTGTFADPDSPRARFYIFGTKPVDGDSYAVDLTMMNDYEGAPADVRFNVVVHGLDKAYDVFVGDHAVDSQFDPATGTLKTTLTLPYRDQTHGTAILRPAN